MAQQDVQAGADRLRQAQVVDHDRVVGVEREHEHDEEERSPERGLVGLLQPADRERRAVSRRARRAAPAARPTARWDAGGRPCRQARGCRPRAARRAATGARPRRERRPPHTRRCHRTPGPERRRASAARRRSRSRRSAKVSARPSAPITASSAEASSSTIATATSSSCCRASARRHIVTSRPRPPLWARLIALDGDGSVVAVLIARRPPIARPARLERLGAPRARRGHRPARLLIPVQGALAEPPPVPKAAAWIVEAPGHGGLLLHTAPTRSARSRRSRSS